MDGGLVISALLLGLGGSLHCASMCGPLVFSVQQSYGIKGVNGGIVFYHLARIIAYLLLAFLFSLIQLPAKLFGIQQYISLISGVILLLLVFKDNIRFVRKALDYISKSLSKGIESSIRFKASLPILGFLNGLLPCGLSYAAAAISLSYGNTSNAMMFMTFFGMGTLPLFLIASLAATRLSQKLRFLVNRYMKYALGLTAFLLVLRGAGLDIPYLSPAMDNDSTEVNCCHVKE